MASPLMISASEISTHFRCDNCGITIDAVAWKQCKICKVFDLCRKCGKLKYNQLYNRVRNDHTQQHIELSEHGLITDDCIELILVEQAEFNGQTVQNKIRDEHLNRIQKEKKICNDYDMSIVMDQLEKMKLASSSLPSQDLEWHGLDSLLARYHLEAHERQIRVLSLDGGGVRGYMPIKIISELVTQKYLSLNEPFDPHNVEHKKVFKTAQEEFTKQFDYFVGTSAGGLVSFCLAMNHSVLELMDIFAKSSHYFWRNYLGPVIYSKYNPARIHQKIDDIINNLPFKGGKKLSAENATLLDIRNILNPDNIITDDEIESRGPDHGNILEFVDTKDKNNKDRTNESYFFHQVNHEKVLLITSYNTTTNTMTIFNTSYAPHWGYRIADVLKATMAAPTYFPPMNISTWKNVDGHFEKDGEPELFIDGGVFANDPELAALWAIRMQWKKPANYHLLSIGTGCYNTTLSSSTWGGYLGWLANHGYLVNTLMDAPRSFIEIIGSNLAKFSNIRRMKLNYDMEKAMALDDGKFVGIFDKEWEQLKTAQDYKAFVYFYDNYICKKI